MENKLTWVSHPVKESIKKNIIALLGIIIILVGGFIWLYIPGVLMGFVIILLTLLPYFMPTKYSIDEHGIRVQYMFQNKLYEWKHFRSFYIDENGVLMSPFSSPSRLENFRGIYVRYGDKKKEIIELIKSYME